MSREQEIEARLNEANRRLEAATAALAPKHKGGEWAEYHAAYDVVLDLERELAETRGEPYAVPCDFPVRWDAGAPLPFLLCNDYQTYLTFYLRDTNTDWDGTTVKVVDPGSAEVASLCLVKFIGCASAKLGHPNVDALNSHPLSGRGLRAYTAQLVRNSPWIEDLAEPHNAHQNENPEEGGSLKHYVFWFHDSTFECLAESFEVEVTNETMTELLGRVQTRLLE